jgi:hypothetical protein
MEISVRTRRPAPATKSARDMYLLGAGGPYSGRANAITVSRQTDRGSIMIGRTCRNDQSWLASAYKDGTWSNLGKFTSSHAAFMAVVSRTAQRVK